MCLKNIVGFFLLVYFYGCSAGVATFSVEVDSITDPEVNPKTKYYLYPGDTTISANDLYFKEYCSYLRTVLNLNGYKQTTLDSAEILVMVRYGIGDPILQTYSYSIPIIERTDAGSKTINSTSTTYGNIGSTNVSGTTTSTTTVDTKPKYDVVGANTYSGTYTTYFRYLILDAIDWSQYKLNGATNNLWKTTISSEGSSNDLRLVVPVMIVGASNYIGKNTGRKIELDVKENDPRIQNLKNGLLIK